MGRLLPFGSLSGWPPYFRGRASTQARRDPESPPPAHRGGLHFLWCPAPPQTHSLLGNEVFYQRACRPAGSGPLHLVLFEAFEGIDVEPEFESVIHSMRSGSLRISKWELYFKLSQTSRASSTEKAHLGGPDFFPSREEHLQDRVEPGCRAGRRPGCRTWEQIDPNVEKCLGFKGQRSVSRVVEGRKSAWY